MKTPAVIKYHNLQKTSFANVWSTDRINGYLLRRLITTNTSGNDKFYGISIEK